ncbi:2-oxoacid:ferredoxin oxidoreductase subunit beta [Alkalilimnicola ehrlichii MLHE-1]|uniref:Thiamine pyrophosphate enzyme domain protein TPP-binding protein n=1 Tax=Alkalilimnicola ehrlichii (strain ATCC BAA-1101 / DSM 17681 / MLHE-1) TaxID=187272 RepID=Q0AAJ6_ALKEH|nr:2-oxoacid:ferredoxin oxidoreductase subunit beta [Alkalilimnicola ehrlichii]ABI56141.1 thiamine pyrophosphate enzyme domain protein TPP-binding protein [Alkalilimnicola ehrlichii MLHE-1]
MSTAVSVLQQRKPADFASDQQVRWCPGCGDYAILKGIQKTLAGLDAPREQQVFISGIGCSSRLPYYLETYGFHTIHGRAPAVATGVKLGNPTLDVWVVTGDGDGLSIGGNHLLHALRRNTDLQILLFNNEIYGLTKGQSSPTSRPGTRSPTSAAGSTDDPVVPARFALGAGARFVARAVDTDQKTLPEVLERAYRHRGASLVELYQNCIVYNDRVFAEITDKDRAPDNTLRLVHGAPMRYGRDGEKGLRLNPRTLTLEVVRVGTDDGVPEDELLVHDERNPLLAGLLAQLQPPEFPVALGVLYCDPEPQAAAHAEPPPVPAGDVQRLLEAGAAWQVA